MTSHYVTEAIRQRFRQFAERECKGYSEHYYRLAHAVADSDQIVDFLSHRADQQPNLFLAAIQFLTGTDGMPRDGTELTAFLGSNADALASVMEVHRTQTNEIGRCAVLLPAMPRGPIALLEIGASGGLCLLLDRCFYDYGVTHIGDNKSEVRLRCELSGPPPEPLTMPDVVWRRGLDRNPVDLHDDMQVRWLRACIWTQHIARRDRFDAAVRAWRAGPPIVSRGDLVDDLPSLAALAPKDASLVVFHSPVLAYVPQERRILLHEALRTISEDREVVWISHESRGASPGLDGGHVPDPEGSVRFVLARTIMRHGEERRQVIGRTHPHGASLEWAAEIPRR